MKLTLAEVAAGEAMRWQWKTGDAKADMRQLADILRQRAGVGWNTILSAETAILVAEAMEAYAPAPPAPPPAPRAKSPGERFHIDLFSSGSAIYRLDDRGEIFEAKAWARNSLVAGVAFEKLVKDHPNDRYIQKRGSWIERP